MTQGAQRGDYGPGCERGEPADNALLQPRLIPLMPLKISLQPVAQEHKPMDGGAPRRPLAGPTCSHYAFPAGTGFCIQEAPGGPRACESPQLGPC